MADSQAIAQLARRKYSDFRYNVAIPRMNIEHVDDNEFIVSWENPRGEKQRQGLFLIALIFTIVWVPLISAMLEWPSFIAIAAGLLAVPCGCVTVLISTLAYKCVFSERTEFLRFSVQCISYEQARPQSLFLIGQKSAAKPAIKNQISSYSDNIIGLVYWVFATRPVHVLLSDHLQQLQISKQDDACCTILNDKRIYIGALLNSDVQNTIYIGLQLWRRGESISRIANYFKEAKANLNSVDVQKRSD
jgi:hypothetical protein